MLTATPVPVKEARGDFVPPSGTPLLFRDVGGAFGASLRVWNRGLVISGRRTHTQGGAHAYGHSRSRQRSKGGLRPPFRNPPPFPGRWGRLRRIAPRLEPRPGDLGKTDSHTGRSPCLRPLPFPSKKQGGTSSPLPEPPSFSGTFGAPSAHRSASGTAAWRSREDGLT